jgi:hypothetical protein
MPGEQEPPPYEVLAALVASLRRERGGFGTEVGDGASGWPSKGEAGADGVRYGRFAEAAAHRVLGSPSGAVRGHQHVWFHLRQVVKHAGDRTYSEIVWLGAS